MTEQIIETLELRKTKFFFGKDKTPVYCFEDKVYMFDLIQAGKIGFAFKQPALQNNGQVSEKVLAKFTKEEFIRYLKLNNEHD